ncbi:hypothetical protein EIH07_04220 [Chryseobacterium taklimakanense]|uniref:hypothetical protein n=1 Tax=Chryseobacterium taklimakanense TaxID=536441 RepID=UPI000F5FF42E|nr:hypothetical protein [Chryseobacterium taklimakanense]AZI22306.1 hypothetical protein EIH07_04220 [Chryseobacterium taklimakanense]
MWRWVALGSGFCGVLLAVGHSFPYPQRLFRRERLGDEKKVLRRTALPENGNGRKDYLFALQQEWDSYKHLQQQIMDTDLQIDRLLKEFIEKDDHKKQHTIEKKSTSVKIKTQ